MKKTHKGLLLGILALAQFMVVLDGSIVNIALSAIMKSLHFSPDSLQWVVTGYVLAFGGFLLLGGRAADLFGRRRVFMTGLIAFTIGSMFVGLAQNEAMVIVARAVQGLAAAFMSPSALSIILTEFREGSERNKALGVWGAVGAGGAAAGLILGGILTQFLGWRWDFIINVPVGIILAMLAIRFVPEHGSKLEHNDLDLPGAFTVTGGLISLVYGLTRAPQLGWSAPGTLVWLGVAAGLLALFVWNESRSAHPLVPLSIFRIRNLSGANLAQLPVTAFLMPMFFFVSLYLQNVLGFGPLEAGLSFLPFALTIGLTTTTASRYIARFGYKPFMVVAPLITASGMFYLSHLSAGGSYLTGVLPALVIMAFGNGMTFISISIAATSGVPRNEAGLASGLLNTAQQIGGALGLAVLTGVAASTTKHALANAGAQIHPAVLAAATVSGYHTALLLGTTFAVGSSLISLIVIQQRRGEPKTAEAIGPELELSRR
jgi:EmrB/QacA subfamily drug resistance transporter